MFFLGDLAQWLAQRTHNPLVAGSNPAGPTKTAGQRLCPLTFFSWRWVLVPLLLPLYKIARAVPARRVRRDVKNVSDEFAPFT